MAERKLSGLFINCAEARDSIHESGKMAYRCLLGSEKFVLDYLEITAESLAIPTDYDFYLFNYHFAVMAWLEPRSIKRVLPGIKMTLVLEVSPNDPFVFCSPDDFDIYCVLDPTLKPDRENVFSFQRPLETNGRQIPFEDPEIPVIGSFGFATPGKGFEHVVDAVNREFDRAVVRINIPHSDYVVQSREAAAQMAEVCKSRAKTGVDVVVTHDYMSKEELIDWCAQNTLNCFLYDRNHAGLAATTDQAITSGRPLITSKNNTFRHITKYIKPFPYQSLKEAIDNTQPKVAKMQADWSQRRFRERFEEILCSISSETRRPILPKTVAPDLKPVPEGPIYWLHSKIAIRTRIRRLKDWLRQLKGKTDVARSYSQFGEDAVIYDLFKVLGFKQISYLDIGANNPDFFSNTFMFYELGHCGLLAEPNSILCDKLQQKRPRDKVLNVGIGFDENVKDADFYVFSGINDGLSTFSTEVAKHWETVGLDKVLRKADRVEKIRLMNVNDVIETHFTEFPDFVSIDVEGWDLQILETMNFDKFTPAVLCAETLAYNSDGSTYRVEAIHRFLESKGYFAFYETYANTIFVNKNLYDFYLYQQERNETLRRPDPVAE